MANSLVSAAAGVDRKGEKLIPMFGAQLNVTDPYWYCSMMEEGLYGEPGSCEIIIPCQQGVRDSASYDVAFNPEGPSAYIKQGTKVKILRAFQNADGENFTKNLQGFEVTEITHDANNDRLVVKAKDGLHLLTDIYVTGRYIWSLEATEVKYQQGWFPHFNPNGRPNCRFTPAGTPVFSDYPDQGLATDERVPSEQEARENGTTCYWSLSLMLDYLRTFYAYDAPEDGLASTARTLAAATWKQVKFFPEWINWPVGFGSSIDQTSLTNFNQGTGQNFETLGGGRKGRDLNIGGMAFIGVGGQPGIFQTIFDSAGPWSFRLDTAFYDTAIFRNTLVAVPTNYRSDSDAVELPYAFRGDASEVFKQPVIAGGEYTENSEMARTRFVGMGSHALIETRCSSRAADHGGGSRTADDQAGTGTPALVPAWSAQDLDDLCTAAVVGGRCTEETFRAACAEFWWVLTTWSLNPAFEFQTGTNHSGKSRAKITRPIWPTLLSFAGEVNKAGDYEPYPVRPEVYDGTDWTLGVEQDGFAVSDNGNIYLPGLREIPIKLGGRQPSGIPTRGSWRSRNEGFFPVVNNKLDLIVNDLRFTMAIPCDHRLTYEMDVSVRGGSDLGVIQSIDAGKFESGFSRTLVVDLNGLYVSWLRYNSYPVPEEAGGTMFPNKVNDAVGTEALRSDIEKLQAHVQKIASEHSRLICSGEFYFPGRFVEGVRVGTQVRALKPVGSTREPFVIRRVIGRKRYTSESTTGPNGVRTFKNSTHVFPI